MREEPVSQRVTRTQPSIGSSQSICVHFEAAWQAESTPRIEDYLGMEPGEAQMAELRERLVALVAIDLRYRWRSSPSETRASRAPTESTLDSVPPLPSHPRLEDYLRRYPALGPLAELPESLILAEYQARHAYGDMPSHIEYRERFPAVAARLDDFLTAAGQSQAGQPSWILPPPSVDTPAVPALSLDEFLVRLAESRLLSEEELAAIREELPPGEEPQDARALADRLVAAGKLTRYQVEAIGQGQATRLVLGEYVLLERLGAGGMGEVFKARHRTMRRIVALKVLAPRLVHLPEALKRFHHEVQAAARLIHPNIVTAFDAGEQAGIHYLVMEYVDGQDLGRLLRGGPLPLARAIDYILQVARGLDYAHRQGVIHRDIKPANLLLDRQGTVKILDMGLARMEETLAGEDRSFERLTSTGQVMGTCDYMAPEQAEDTSQADARSDLYALGCSLYHLLTGHPPYRGKSFMQVLVAHRDAPISSLRADREDLPESLERIYRRMVAKRPEDRYQSAAELVADLEAFRDGAPGAFVGLPRASLARRRRLILAVLGSVLVGGLALAIVLAFSLSWDRASQAQPESPAPLRAGDSASSSQDASAPRSRPAPARLSLVRQTLPIAPGEPLSPFTLVTTPASIPGVRSWTIETWHHRGDIFDIAYSPDGTLLASCGRDGTIRLWRHGLLLAGMCVGQGADARAVAWSPDGRYLASVGVDQQVRLWGIPGGEPIRAVSSRSAKDSVAWSPDGTHLAVAGEGNEIELWDVASGSLVKRLQGHANVVRHLAWSPDGRQLASCAADQTIRLWEVTSGGASRVVNKFDDSVVRLAWSPNGLLLASIAGDKVILQDPVDGIVRRTIRPEGPEPLTGLCWSPDGRALATSRRGRISVWDSQSGQRLREFPEERCTTDSLVAWASSGHELALAAEGSVQLWDPGTGQSLAAQEKQTGFVGPLPAWSPDGTTLALHPTMQRVLWNLASGRLARSPASEKLVRGLCWSPDGKMLACSQNGNQIGLYDETFQKCLAKFGQHTAEIVSLNWSPDSRCLASIDAQRQVQIWNPADRQCLSQWKAEGTAPDFLTQLAWSPDATKLVALGDGDTLQVREASTGELLHTLDSAALPVAWSPDGRRIASRADDSKIRVWDANSGRVLRTLAHHGFLRVLTWSSDSKTVLVCGMHDISTFGADSGRVLRTLPIAHDILMSWLTAVSPDKKYGVNQSHSGVVRLVELATARVIRTLAFLPGDHYLILNDQGHYVGSPGVENEFCYVVETDRGRELLPPTEFARKFGWQNDSRQACLSFVATDVKAEATDQTGKEAETSTP